MSEPITKLRVLIVEDSEAEALLVIRELRKGGFDVVSMRVDTAPELEAALAASEWDVVVSDYEMPYFDAPSALAVCRRLKPDIPFVVVTGKVGEETAVETLKAGADDYLMKDRLARLPAAIHSIQAHAVMRQLRGEAEGALQASEEKYRSLVENLNDLIFVVDKTGVITFVSSVISSLTGYSKADVVGHHFCDFIFAPDLPVVTTALNDVLGGKLYQSEYRIVKKSGDLRWVNSSSLPVVENGSVVGLRGRMTDITDRKMMEFRKEQLAQADKMIALGTLVSGVAHEINNPTNFIMLNSPIVRDVWDSVRPILDRYYDENGDFLVGGLSYQDMKDQVPKLLSGIDDGALRIKRIVADLKRFARLEPLDLSQDVDVNEVIESAVALMRNMVSKATSRFEVEYGVGVPVVKGSFQKIEQVVINLVQNACEALSRSEQGIRVSTLYSPGSGLVSITVADEGVGIPDEIVGRIMDPFFTTKRDTGGTGLGLSVSLGIVRDHGGTLEFTSAMGNGTCAVVKLPAKA